MIGPNNKDKINSGKEIVKRVALNINIFFQEAFTKCIGQRETNSDFDQICYHE